MAVLGYIVGDGELYGGGEGYMLGWGFIWWGGFTRSWALDEGPVSQTLFSSTIYEIYFSMFYHGVLFSAN